MSPNPSTLACNSAVAVPLPVSTTWPNPHLPVLWVPPPPVCYYFLSFTLLSGTVWRAVLLPLHFNTILIRTLPFIKSTLLPFLCTHIGAYARIVAIRHNPFNRVSIVFFWNVEIDLIRQKHHLSWYQMLQSFFFFFLAKHGEIILISNWHSRVAKLRR